MKNDSFDVKRFSKYIEFFPLEQKLDANSLTKIRQKCDGAPMKHAVNYNDDLLFIMLGQLFDTRDYKSSEKW